MTDAEMLDQLTEVFRSVFDDESVVARSDMTAADVERWDSLTHIDLIVSVEEVFRIRIPTREVAALQNVGDLMRVIRFEDRVSQTPVLRLALRPDLVEAFVVATGDRSAIHLDDEFARCSRFRGRIVHGLLPIACLVLGATRQGRFTGRRLQRLACRFLAPAHPGDTLDLFLDEAETTPGGTSFGFRVLKADDATVVTQGAMTWTDEPGVADETSAGPATLFPAPLFENALAVADLAAGTTEALTFTPQPKVLAALGSLLEGPVCVDRNLVAVLPVSTLIGMRLPGRHATFSEFEAIFAVGLSAEAPVTLVGTVDKVMVAGGHARLALTWSQDDAVVARGFAHAMISPAAPAGIGCAALQTGHLATGIAGKVALVTGASRGIGEATAKLLAMHGARVAVHYHRGERAAAEIVADIAAHNGHARAFGADLRSDEARVAMFERIRKEFGGVDILVNNAVAGFSPRPLESLTASDYLGELEVSLFGMHGCCTLALPHMRARRGGKIINVSTIAAECPVGGQNQYITVKSAVVGYTRSLAVELCRHNIQVNLVVPRMTDTTLIASLPPGLRARLAEESPTGHLLQPVEVAKAIVFLASTWSGSMSGQKLILNQGEAPFL